MNSAHFANFALTGPPQLANLGNPASAIDRGKQQTVLLYHLVNMTMESARGMYERSLAVETVFLVWDRCGCWFFYYRLSRQLSAGFSSFDRIVPFFYATEISDFACSCYTYDQFRLILVPHI
jgi:hypothetical protein